jgi:hypothetical protein
MRDASLLREASFFLSFFPFESDAGASVAAAASSSVASALALASIVPGGVGSSAAGGDDGGNSSLRTSGSVAAAAESSCGAGTGAVIERCVGKTGGFAMHLMNPTPFADNFTITATAQPNRAPAAQDQSMTTDEDTAKAITLTGDKVGVQVVAVTSCAPTTRSPARCCTSSSCRPTSRVCP